MKNSITNKIRMYDQVALACASHNTVWTSVPAFVESHTEFIGKLDALKAHAIAQENAISGVVDSKRATLDKVIALAVVASKAISALALKLGNPELLARNIYSRSEWFRGNALLRSARLSQLLDDVNTHATALDDYGIDSAFVAELQAQVSAYNSAVQAPRQAILNRKRATAALDRSVAEIDALLNGQLDRIIEVFRANYPTFAEDYFNARIIVDLKGKRRGSGESNEGGTYE